MSDTKKTEDSIPVGEGEERELPEEEHLFEDWDELTDQGEDESRLGKALEGLVPGILKRSVEGLVAEDGLRSVLLDRGMPREAVGFILGQADATRREVVRIVSKEVRIFLENVDLGGELTKILTSVSFEIRTEVRFIPNDAVVKPSVRNRVKVKGAAREEEEPEEEESPEAGLEVEEREEKEARPRKRRWPLGRTRGAEEEEDEDPSPGK